MVAGMSTYPVQMICTACGWQGVKMLLNRIRLQKSGGIECPECRCWTLIPRKVKAGEGWHE